MPEQKKTQREKFEEAARESGADQSVDTFEALAAKIAHAPKLAAEQIKEFARRNAAKPK